MENFAWNFFEKTGNIDVYLLYKQTMNMKENSDEYGVSQNLWCCDQEDKGQRQ
ncbi:MAG: YqzL family protein [Ruminococcaceae bacterium]|nr:YqzL family protein [Oscillospiraceae bacterium]